MGWFNPQTVAPDQGGGAQWPVGTHRVVAVKSEQTPIKDATDGSSMLVFTLRVIEGPLTNFEAPYRLNIWHKGSPQAAEIAGKQLSAMCYSVGYVQELNNGPQQGGIASELFNKPFRIVVTPQQKDPQYTQISQVTRDDGTVPKAGDAGAPQGPQNGPSGPQQTQQGYQPPQQTQQFQPNNPAQQQGGNPSWQQQPSTGGTPNWNR